MHKGRLEAFSDGVIAIIITIMVLNLRDPQSAEFSALRPVYPTLLSYALSFIFVGIYWNNHHHMFQVTQRVNGAVLWANLHLLFWLSLVPFVTNWVGETHFAPSPIATYGIVLLMAGFAYWILELALLRVPSGNDLLAAAIGRDFKGKISLVIYAVAIGLSFVSQWIACGLYVLVALIWLIPDPRIERTVAKGEKGE
jgi:uncharacterized membrane protein